MSANADVVFRMGADVDEAIRALEQVQAKIRETKDEAERKSGKGGLAGVLGMDAGDAFDKADEAVKGFTGGAVSLSGVLGGLGVAGGMAAAGVAAVGAAVYASLDDAIAAEDTANRLRIALAGQGAETADNVAALNDLASALSDTSRFSSGAITDMQSMAMQMGVNVTRMDSFSAAAVGAASALQLDLGTAGKMLAQTLDGTAGKLGMLIPEVGRLTEAQLKAGAAIDVVREKFAGMASGDLDTVGGALAQLKNTTGDLTETFGLAFTDSSDLAGVFQEMRGWAADLAPTIRELGSSLGYLAGAAFEALKPMADLRFLFEEGANALAGVTAGAYIEAGERVRELGMEMRALEAQAADANRILGATGDSVTREQQTKRLSDVTAELTRKQLELAGAVQQVAAAKAAMSGQNVTGTRSGAASLTDGSNPPKAASGGKSEGDKVREQVTELMALVAASSEAVARIDSLNLSLEDERDLHQEIAGILDGAENTLTKLYMNGKITADEYLAKLREVKDEQAAFKAATADEDFAAFQSAYSARVAGGTVGEPMQAAVPDYGEGTIDMASGERVGEREYEESDQLALQAQLETDMFDRRMELIAQGYEMSEVEMMLTEQFALQRAEVDGNVTEQERLAMAQAKQMKAAQQQGAAILRQRATMNLLRGSVVTTAQAFGQMAVSGELSAKKLTAVMIGELSKLATHKATEQLARAAAAAGAHDYAAAAKHTLAATLWGMLGGAAAGYAAGGGGGEGGGSGGSGEGGSGSSLGLGSGYDRDRVEEGQRPMQLSVMFTGNGIIAGTTPEAFANAMAPFLQEVVRESGGRNSSVRP